MGFGLEALVGKVGHKIDKKKSNANLKRQGSYDRISNSLGNSEQPSQCSDHPPDHNNSESFTGVGHFAMGREPRRPIADPNYHDSARPDKEKTVFEGSTDPAFTGGGLLGKLMNARQGAASGKGEVGTGNGPSYARQESGRTPIEGQQEPARPPGRYRHENGPPKHEALRHRKDLNPDHARQYQPGASHEHRKHESERHGPREFGGEKEKLQNPFDDRERY